jgi:hypothetical protein
MNRQTLGFALAASLIISPLTMAATPSPAGASAYIISPADGESVKSPFKVRFGLSGMGVAPAGIDKPNTGHHHLLIDLADTPPMSKPLPSDANRKHFGGGQTEVMLELPPGEHTLQLLLGDQNHVPHDPPVMSQKITVTVE